MLSSAILPCLLALAFAAAPPPTLLRLPLRRLPVPAKRAFSVAHRPWAASQPSPARAPLLTPRARPPTAHLSFPLTLHPTPANLSHALPTAPMAGNLVSLGEFYLTLLFGSQPINVQVDTGSSTTAVPLAECLDCLPRDHRLDLSTAVGTAGLIACDSPACTPDTCARHDLCTTCHAKTNACCSDIAPDACAFYLRYADQSGVSGALVQADVTIAGLTVPLAFGGILKETTDFENTNVDGILGLAYKSLACNPTCVLPLFDTLVQAAKVKDDIFSLCTSRDGGTLILGGSSNHFYHGDLQYVPMKHGPVKHFYEIPIQHVQIGEKKVKVPHFSDAIVDSGTTVLVITHTAYDAIKAHFQSNYCHVPGLCVDQSGKQVTSAHVFRKPEASSSNETEADAPFVSRASEDKTWFSPGFCVKLEKRHLEMLPNITIGLQDGVELVLDPEIYMLEYEVASTIGWGHVLYRCLGISFLNSLENMENNVILGNTVLQKYFVEYDRKNDRIGFAVAKNCVDPSAKMLGANSTTSQMVRTLPRWVLILLAVASIGTWILLLALCAREARKNSEYRPIPSSRS